MKYWIGFITIISILMLIGCSPVETEIKNIENKSTGTDTVLVHYIDVGQGDATLLQGPDFTILIDAGRHDQDDVVPYLQRTGITEMDLVVGTHPHADHIGQLDKVLETFPVKEIWMSGDMHTTRTFERVIDAIASSGAEYYEPRAGEEFQIGSISIEVINPAELTGDFHEGSISLRATYGEVTFLFTGDAEKQTEEAILTRGHNVKAQVFQLGHHGSSTSNTRSFLEAVQPELAIYSAARNNDYGHPHREVMALLEELQIPVHGTDTEGTIIIETDGQNFTIQANRVTTTDCVNINAASVEQLAEIIHIDGERAQALIELRPFAKVEDLTRINGIGAGRIKDIIEQGLACVS